MEKYEKYLDEAPRTKLSQWWRRGSTPLAKLWLILFILLFIVHVLGI